MFTFRDINYPPLADPKPNPTGERGQLTSLAHPLYSGGNSLLSMRYCVSEASWNQLHSDNSLASRLYSEKPALLVALVEMIIFPFQFLYSYLIYFFARLASFHTTLR